MSFDPLGLPQVKAGWAAGTTCVRKWRVCLLIPMMVSLLLSNIVQLDLYFNGSTYQEEIHTRYKRSNRLHLDVVVQGPS